MYNKLGKKVAQIFANLVFPHVSNCRYVESQGLLCLFLSHSNASKEIQPSTLQQLQFQKKEFSRYILGNLLHALSGESTHEVDTKNNHLVK